MGGKIKGLIQGSSGDGHYRGDARGSISTIPILGAKWCTAYTQAYHTTAISWVFTFLSFTEFALCAE